MEPSKTVPTSTAVADPLAALEQQQTKSNFRGEKASEIRVTSPSGTNAADDFLAQLERDIHRSK